MSDRVEHDLLLRGIRPLRDPENDERIRVLAQKSVDWDYLFSLLRRHGVLQLFYFHLQQCAADLIPFDQLQRLQKYFQENAARNVILTAELCRLTDRLQAAGIEVLPYKGPVLALFAYGNIALRRFVDLDIMVRREDVDQAIEIIEQEGYEFSRPLTSPQREVLLRTQHNLQFRRHHGQLIVELHWEVASRLFASSVQAVDLWENLIDLKLNQIEIKTLAAEDLVFSLCVHGSRHLWERLLWICDIGWIVAKHDLDWHKLLSRARVTKTERMFLLGPYLAASLLNVRLPDVVTKEIRKDGRLDELATRVAAALFFKAEHIPATPAQIFRYNWQIRRAWSSRARYLGQALKPTDRDLEAIVFPRHFAFGYYLLRPFRVFLGGSKGP